MKYCPVRRRNEKTVLCYLLKSQNNNKEKVALQLRINQGEEN